MTVPFGPAGGLGQCVRIRGRPGGLGVRRRRLVGLDRGAQPGLVGNAQQRVDDEVVGRVDRMADTEPLREVDGPDVLAVGVVVVGRPVAGRSARAVELAHRRRHEVDGHLLGPLGDRARLLVGRGEQDRQYEDQADDDPGRDHDLLDQVVTPVGALPFTCGLVLGPPGVAQASAALLAIRGRGGRRRLVGRQAFERIGRHDAVPAHEQDVRDDEPDHRERQQEDVPAVHLAEVREVEERADPGRVHRVLGLRGDPLRVEVLL